MRVVATFVGVLDWFEEAPRSVVAVLLAAFSASFPALVCYDSTLRLVACVPVPFPPLAIDYSPPLITAAAAASTLLALESALPAEAAVPGMPLAAVGTAVIGTFAACIVEGGQSDLPALLP